MLNVIAPGTDRNSKLNILHYMRNNIPFAVVIAMSLLNQYVRWECTPMHQTLIIITFTVLTVADVIWTAYHCKVDFTYNYPHIGSRWKRYAVVRSLTSVLSFYSVNYFVHQGIPFNCFFPYNVVASNILLYVSFVVISVISYIEHYYWKNNGPPERPAPLQI
jgi:hypothetical protein